MLDWLNRLRRSRRSSLSLWERRRMSFCSSTLRYPARNLTADPTHRSHMPDLKWPCILWHIRHITTYLLPASIAYKAFMRSWFLPAFRAIHIYSSDVFRVWLGRCVGYLVAPTYQLAIQHMYMCPMWWFCVIVNRLHGYQQGWWHVCHTALVYVTSYSVCEWHSWSLWAVQRCAMLIC